MSSRRFRSRRSRGLTLIEIMVSMAVMAMISILLYGAFTSLANAKKGEGIKADRARQGRSALLRIVREVSAAYLSAHQPNDRSLIVRTTAFTASGGGRFARVDFTAFAHRRTFSGAPESDQAEIGYFVVQSPIDKERHDLVRREQTPIDLEPNKGGIVNVLVDDIESFEMRYLDPINGQWLDNWDTTNASAQGPRLPLEVHITLKLGHVPPGCESVFTTKALLPITQPLAFGRVQ